MPSYVFKAFFTSGAVGVAPAVAPTVDVVNGAGALVVTAGPSVVAAGAVGLYSYTYTGAADEYVAIFKTTSTVDLKHVPSWTPTVLYTNLDATVSSRNATTPPTAGAIADQVWDQLAADNTIPLSTGALLATAGAAADPLLNLVPGVYPSGSAGAALGNIAGANVTVVSPVAADGTAISLTYGDDYFAADNRALMFADLGGPVLTGGAVALRVQAGAGVVSLTGVITGAHACYVEVTAVQVASLGPAGSVWHYDLEATLVTTAHVVTLVAGAVTVAADVR